MKNISYKLLAIMAVLMLSTVWYGDLSAYGTKSEFKKEISKEMPISANGKVIAKGKYGVMDVSTWDGNKVKYDVKIIVKAEDKAKADEMFERISIDFDQGTGFTSAKYDIAESKNKSWWKQYKGISYAIHFTIKIPKTCSVDLYNKYGHIHLTDIDGDAKIEQKYADVKASDIGGDVELMIGYGKANLGNIGNLEVEIKYGKLDIESAKDIDITSKYSHLYIDNAGKIKSQTKYDKYYLGDIEGLRNYGKYDDFEIRSIKNIDIEGKYSDFDIKKLHGSATFEMRYGDAEIRTVTSSFQGVSFKGDYADLMINLDGKGIDMELEGEYTSMKLPSSSKKTKEIKNDNQKEIAGTINGGGNAKVKVSAEHGSIVIYE